MQYIPIKKEFKNGETVYTVNAIPLKNTKKTIVQKIPHPLGTDVMEFSSVEQAKEAIIRAGFACILPDGQKEFQTLKSAKQTKTNDYETAILTMLQNKINSSNPNISQSAILVLSQFPGEQTFEILFKKIGEDNDIVRKNAINAICEYGNYLQDKIIDALKHENWVTRNSALTCIKNLAEDEIIDYEKFIQPLIDACDDNNPIVQSSALSTLAFVYKKYKKQV